MLGFVLLAFPLVPGRGIGGSPWAGAVMVLLFSGLPLLGQQMAGGGFDLLNLVMLTAVVLLAREFERRDAVSQEALVLGAVLLAYSRYESVLFLGAGRRAGALGRGGATAGSRSPGRSS